MGKRIIISGADFSANGMKGPAYVERSSTTEQGIIVLTTGANFGRLGTTSTGGYYYDKYLHTNEVITLEPGETLAIMERPSGTNRAMIFAYSDVEAVYPSLVCGTAVQPVGTVAAWTSIDGKEPKTLANTAERTWYIVLLVNNRSASISRADIPSVGYRIYTDHPERFEGTE